MSTPSNGSPFYKRKPFIAFAFALTVIGLVLDIFVVYTGNNQSPVSNFLNLPSSVVMILGKLAFVIGVFLIVVVIFSSDNKRLKQALPRMGIVFASLFAFTLLIWISPTISSTSLASPTNAVFNIPINKIQTDLATFKDGDSIVLVIVVNNQAYRYDAKLIDVQGAGSVALIPPYKNKEATIVHISLLRGANDINTEEFANLLTNTNAIFLLPSIPTPTPTSTSTLTPILTPVPTQVKIAAQFSLPIDKIQSNLHLIPFGTPTPTSTQTSISTSMPTPIMLLIVAKENHQVYRYDVQVTLVKRSDITPTPTLNQTSTLQVNSDIISVSIRLTDATDQVIVDFAGQLSDADAIYLFPSS